MEAVECIAVCKTRREETWHLQLKRLKRPYGSRRRSTTLRAMRLVAILAEDYHNDRLGFEDDLADSEDRETVHQL